MEKKVNKFDISEINNKLNYFKRFIQPNFVSTSLKAGQPGVNTAFYIIYPENIESATDRMAAYRMNMLSEIVNRRFTDETISLRFFCLQTPFDFSYEISRMRELKESTTQRYFKKTAEVYERIYENFADNSSDLRKKIYVMAISSARSINAINTFYDQIKLDLSRAGLNCFEADYDIIQRLFNQIFDMPKNFKGLTIKNQQIHFNKTDSYRTYHYDDNGEVVSSNINKIICIRQTSSRFKALEPFWLSNLFDINDVFVSFDIATLPEKKRDALIGSLRTDFINVRRTRKEVKNRQMDINRSLIESLLDDIASGDQDLKLVTILIQIRAKNKKELKSKFLEVNKVLNQHGLVYGSINFRQHPALELLQPFKNGDILTRVQKEIEMAFPTDAIGNAYPFTQTSLLMKDGALLGRSDQGSPMIFNLCDRSKALSGNMCVWGTTGSGKSTLIKTLITGNLLNSKNQQTLIIDFENEYGDIARNYDQQIIEFTRSADEQSPTINIFQIPEVDTFNVNTRKFEQTSPSGNLKNAFISQIQYVLNIFKIILSKEDTKLTNNEINVLEREIKKTYWNFKIDAQTNFNKIPNKKWPTVDDLYEQIGNEVKKLAKKDPLNSLDDYKQILRLIEPFTKEGVYDGIFNKYTNIDVKEQYKLVVFNLHGLLDIDTPDEIKTAMLMSVMRYWNNIMIQQRKRYPFDRDPNAKYITFIVDEFHKLVNNRYPQGLELLSSMYAQLRKYYSQIIVATQSLATFTKAQNEDIKRYLNQMLDNSYYKVVLGMSEKQLGDINDVILYDSGQLTDQERMFLATSSNIDGLKFVLIMGEKERISGRIYSASRRLHPSEMRKKFNDIEEPLQLWQEPLDNYKDK